MTKGRTNGAKIAVAMAVIAVLGAGCLKTEEFPTQPVITFKSFEVFPDSASLTISFTDGDGDIGLDQGDTLAPFNPPYDPDRPWYYNFFVDAYYLQNGVWQDPGFVLPLYYRVPDITPTGQNKALEGDIAVAINNAVLDGLQALGDTVKFEVRLADRARQMSNRVSSAAIVLP
ncbi:MAG TPA: hypothetical protein VGE21_06905 [Flavobacteriales bacterium]